jgi:hypothetical protein
MEKPLVMIIDIDGTLLGNISPQIMIYEMKQANIQIKYSFKDLFQRFDNGLLRPYIDSFIKSTKKRMPNIEFFIYTSSEDRWGAFIINAIEKYLNIKFNRPIFTRKHCFIMDRDIRKSVKNVTPLIKRALKKKYGSDIDLTNRIMMVDNRAVYQSNEHTQLLMCKTYNFAHPENLPVYITEECFIKYKNIIQNVYKKYYNSPELKTYSDFQLSYYPHYLQELKKINSHVEDKFWFFLNRLMELKNIRIFTPRVIEYMNKKLCKRLV